MGVLAPVQGVVRAPVRAAVAPAGRPLFSLNAYAGALPFGATYTRVGTAYQLAADGSLLSYAADAPPMGNGFGHWGAATNEVRNPRAEGATAGVLGSGGVEPSNWTFPVQLGDREITEIDGYDEYGPYVEVDISGSPAAGAPEFRAEALTQVAAASSQTWTFSWGARLVDGDNTNITRWEIKIAGRDASTQTEFSAEIVTVDETFRRHSITATLADANTDYVVGFLRPVYPGSVPVDYTIRLYSPQLTLTEGQWPPIFPPVSSPADSDRYAANCVYDFGALPAQFYGVVEFERDWLPASGTFPRLLVFGPTTADDDERLTLHISGTTGKVTFSAYDGGVFQAGVVAADAITATTRHKVAYRRVGNALAISMDGASIVSSSGGTAPLHRYMGLAQRANAAMDHLNGRLYEATVVPGTISDAGLQALST